VNMDVLSVALEPELWPLLLVYLLWTLHRRLRYVERTLESGATAQQVSDRRR